MTNQTPVVSIAQTGQVALIRFDDGKANALSLETIGLLRDALRDAANSASAVVLAGNASCFSAGLDKSLTKPGQGAALSQALKALTSLYWDVIDLPAPTVIACTGHAIAAGAVMLLCGDERLAASGPLRIGMTEVDLGIPMPPLAVALARARLVPTSFVRAILQSALFRPEAAAGAGFIDEVHPAEDLIAIAVDRAGSLARLRPEAYLASRRLLWAPVVAEVNAALAARSSP